MVPILYFHGFASSPGSAKIGALRTLLGDGYAIEAPDLNVPSFERLDFDAAVAHALAVGERVAPRVIVGSSMGALVALCVSQRGLRAPLVLIAPAVGVADRWISRLPDGDPIVVFNHARAEDAAIHRQFFERMARVECDRVPPVVPVTIVMGTNDESVPFERVETVWQSWRSKLAPESKFIAVEGGDHGLTAHVNVIAESVREAARGGGVC